MLVSRGFGNRKSGQGYIVLALHVPAPTSKLSANMSVLSIGEGLSGMGFVKGSLNLVKDVFEVRIGFGIFDDGRPLIAGCHCGLVALGVVCSLVCGGVVILGRASGGGGVVSVLRSHF